MARSRRCVGCHETDSPENLLRCVARDGHVVLDNAAREPGRGAWVHRNPSCIESSVSRRAWSRALKVGVALDCSALEELGRAPDLATNRLNG